MHPEFSFLPRKFKIAVTGADPDRAATRLHDIGLIIVRDDAGAVGFEVIVGGGQGRTPVIGEVIRRFLPKRHLLSYLEAILRVYNMLGRRDNLYKARIKILVKQEGIDRFRDLVEEEWLRIRDGALALPADEIERIYRYFAAPDYADLPKRAPHYEARLASDPDFGRWAATNVAAHTRAGYGIVTVSLKPIGGIPGAPPVPSDQTASPRRAD